MSASAAVPVPVGSGGGNPLDGKRAVSMSIVAPGKVWQGRLTNPDPVLQQFGSWEGIAFYSRMFRQFPTLAGICHLAADRVCAIDRTIKPGDPTVGQSREIADNLRRLYAKTEDTHIVNKKMALGRFFGFSATGKAGWRIDEETQLTFPADLYDIPWPYVQFGPNGEVFVLAQGGLPKQIDSPEDKMFFYRWGSRFTPYGEGDLQDVYLATWYLQNVRDFGMTALELLGRPIPWVEVSSMMQPEDLRDLEAGLAKQYKFYVLTKTDTTQTRVTFPSLNVLANGAAGRSELEYIRFLYGEIYIRILGVQMTQDSSGGSRALESTRLDVISDKTPPASQALDEAWTRGWSNHICRVNYPTVDPRLWPRFESDTSAADSTLNGGTIAAVLNVATMLAQKQITATVAEKTLLAAGLPEAWAADMVKSTIDEADDLTPAGQVSTLRPQQPAQQMPMNDPESESEDMSSDPEEMADAPAN